MYVLTIDTSNQVMGVAILKDDVVIGEIVTNIAKNHSVRLMPAIEQLMQEVSLTPDQLNRIVVAKGPGSYTGVRIGLSTAKSMAWALGIPVVGVSSLEVLAYQGRFFDGYICPFFDARRGLVFTGIYQWKEDKLNLVYEEKNISMEEALNKLKKAGEKTLFLSPDLALHKERIHDVLEDLAVLPDGPYHLANPGFLGLAGLNKEPDNTHGLTPNYLRLAEAEANWIKAQEEKK
ncbi:tRNA (adenosine(37)-N6)-threonylcarbamoyltransferase complex dimerization subunit type 1 TsaB [Oceanobacillus halophilus]|uniref:tRNA (Adenosine(37)-N6)-threonylcarbamoyltransferase complex dimerization subunit type 1 TsaB n=1 Tax=Oceanobacillus halophilus TaxID=930130 RepID=A0A494ZRH9_9BACI|nr:tRNA (adenosine(37)-N6)-threonylcarbamoyltransferase complex dimerization subunit type 1 TsaB [Oceanobacillus halophilus]RKQ28324.1 tRNA (adenosine(37)-N6)-threonylcarbamoyltransferase complex dimerization subunit type 1 TsaB [Oceanobacillus halophilus]